MKSEYNGNNIPILIRIFLIKWQYKIDEKVKLTKIKQKNEQNNNLLEFQLNKGLQEKNSLQNLKNSLRRKYPQMTEEELRKTCLQYMKVQLRQTSDMDTTSISSKSSSKSAIVDYSEENQDQTEDKLSTYELYLQIMKGHI